MAWTQADLDALDEAIKAGVQKVQFADRSITYNSMDDLLKARNFAAQQVAAVNGQTLPRAHRVWTRNGWGG